MPNAQLDRCSEKWQKQLLIEDVSAIAGMSTVQEIQTAIPGLSREEIEQIREWIDDYLGEQLELTDDVKAKLDHSRSEIATGQYTSRQSK